VSEGLRFDELLIDYSGIPEPGQYRARDGAQLPVRHYPAESDVQLVLLHGSGYHGRYLYPLARDLSARGVAQVYTPDLRGHGVSPKRRGDVDYIDQLEDDVADLLAQVRSENPAGRVVIGGHSSGGGLALRFAGGARGGEASAVVLLAPFLSHDAPTTRPNSGGWARPRVGRIVVASLLNGFGIHALDATTVIEFAMPEEARDGTETLAYSHRLNTGFAPRDYAKELAAIDVPLLLLVGSDDEAFVADAYAPTISKSAPAADVRVLPGVSHMGVAVGSGSAEAIAGWLSEALADSMRQAQA
jgi:non-heme chloroperoxidase